MKLKKVTPAGCFARRDRSLCLRQGSEQSPQHSCLPRRHVWGSDDVVVDPESRLEACEGMGRRRPGDRHFAGAAHEHATPIRHPTHGRRSEAGIRRKVEGRIRSRSAGVVPTGGSRRVQRSTPYGERSRSGASSPTQSGRPPRGAGLGLSPFRSPAMRAESRNGGEDNLWPTRQLY